MEDLVLLRIDIVVPRHDVSFVQVEWDEYVGEIFIYSPIARCRDHIKRCLITSNNAVVQVINPSDNAIRYKFGQIIASGLPTREAAEASHIHTGIEAYHYPASHYSHCSGKRRLIVPFATNSAELSKWEITKMKIDQNDEKPVTYRLYRLAFKEREEVRNIVSELLEHDIIQESNSPYSNPIVLVKKKTGKLGCVRSAEPKDHQGQVLDTKVR